MTGSPLVAKTHLCAGGRHRHRRHRPGAARRPARAGAGDAGVLAAGARARCGRAGRRSVAGRARRTRCWPGRTSAGRATECTRRRRGRRRGRRWGGLHHGRAGRGRAAGQSPAVEVPARRRRLRTTPGRAGVRSRWPSSRPSGTSTTTPSTTSSWRRSPARCGPGCSPAASRFASGSELTALVPMSVTEDDGEPTSLGSQVAPHLQPLPIGEPNAADAAAPGGVRDPGPQGHRPSGRRPHRCPTSPASHRPRCTRWAYGCPPSVLRKQHDVLITNVPGPQVTLYAAGARAGGELSGAAAVGRVTCWRSV